MPRILSESGGLRSMTSPYRMFLAQIPQIPQTLGGYPAGPGLLRWTQTDPRRGNMRRFRPAVEQCESRICPTLVFIFSGNALAAASTDYRTQIAADQLARHGDQPIQVSTPALNGPGAFYHIADYIRDGEPRAADRPGGFQRRRSPGHAPGRTTGAERDLGHELLRTARSEGLDHVSPRRPLLSIRHQPRPSHRAGSSTCSAGPARPTPIS